MRKRPCVTIVCVYCGNEKSRRKDNVKDVNYCSVSCAAKHRAEIKGPEGHPMWKGGRRVDFFGYIEVYKPDHHRARGNGYVFEHILVMEKELGRLITKEEHIHHIDHNKQNNVPSNLMLLSAADHARIHHKKPEGLTKPCEVCGKDFPVVRSNMTRRKTCSKKCSGILFRNYYVGMPLTYKPTEDGVEKLMNNAVLIGRTTNDVSLRYTNSATAVANFTLAVDRDRKNANGEKETDFLDVIVWGKLAELTAQFLKKGKLAAVRGSIQTRSYENKEGQRVRVTEIVADNVRFLSPADSSQNGSNTQGGQSYGQGNQNGYNGQSGGYGGGYGGGQQGGGYGGGNSFAGGRNDDPFSDDGKPIDISDDIPF